jgi:hypothetical protein
MPRVGFEPAIPASERAKTVHALDHSATATGREFFLIIYLFFIWFVWPIVPASGDSEDDYGEADGM